MPEKEKTLAKGRFKKGESGNPSGRPKGAKNKLTLLKEAVLAKAEENLLENWEEVVAMTIDLAKQGDSTALKILWDRVVPSMKATEGQKHGTGGVTIVVKPMENEQVVIDGEVLKEPKENE